MKFEESQEKIPSDDALNQESAILDQFEAMGVKNPKKIVKLAQRLYAESTHPVQKRLCRDISISADPVKYVTRCIGLIRDCAVIMKQFMDDGCHGMIFTGRDGDEVYPIKLDTRENWLTENKQWDPEQEMIIQNQAADAWLREHDKGYFYGKVVLFPNFGFSGIPRIIEMQCVNDTSGLVKYPGTNFYV